MFFSLQANPIFTFLWYTNTKSSHSQARIYVYVNMFTSGCDQKPARPKFTKYLLFAVTCFFFYLLEFICIIYIWSNDRKKSNQRITIHILLWTGWWCCCRCCCTFCFLPLFLIFLSVYLILLLRSLFMNDKKCNREPWEEQRILTRNPLTAWIRILVWTKMNLKKLNVYSWKINWWLW